MFINISTENIIVQDMVVKGADRIMIPFHDVEKVLSKTVVSLYKKSLPDTIYVLNGPGSFTNLRVGCLTINTLLLLSHEPLQIHMIDKLALYKSVYLSGGLPRYGYIFMGQRKNIWYYDFVQDSYVVYSRSELALMDIDIHHGQGVEFFVDLFVGQDFAEYFAGSDHMIDIIVKKSDIVLCFAQSQSVVTDLFIPTTKMEPHYAMEPNIG